MVGALKDVPTSFGELTTNFAYLDIEGSPLDVIIGDLAMQNLEEVLDLGRRQVRLTKDDQSIEISLKRTMVEVPQPLKAPIARTSV